MLTDQQARHDLVFLELSMVAEVFKIPIIANTSHFCQQHFQPCVKYFFEAALYNTIL